MWEPATIPPLNAGPALLSGIMRKAKKRGGIQGEMLRFALNNRPPGQNPADVVPGMSDGSPAAGPGAASNAKTSYAGSTGLAHNASSDAIPPTTPQVSTIARLALLHSSDKASRQLLSKFVKKDPGWTSTHFADLNGIKSPDKLQALFLLFDKHPDWMKEHFDAVRDKDANWLCSLQPLIEHHQSWATAHLPRLACLSGDHLREMAPFVAKCPEWITKNLGKLRYVPPDGLHGLFELVEKHPAWASQNSALLLRRRDSKTLRALFSLFAKHTEWTKKNFSRISPLNAKLLRMLLSIVDKDDVWVSKNLLNLRSLMDIEDKSSRAIIYFLEHDFVWASKNFHVLLENEGILPYLHEYSTNTLEDVSQTMQSMQGIVIEFSRLSELDPEAAYEFMKKVMKEVMTEKMDAASHGFNRAANPYVNALLDTLPPSASETLTVQGASRSLLHSQKSGNRIASSLTQTFEKNFQELPHATFGLEVEMFVPGMGADYRGDELNAQLGTRNYRFVEDHTLDTPTDLAEPVEMISPILRSPGQIEELQSALSILHDWGAFTNSTSGIHVHTGVKQWNTDSCLAKEEIERIPGIGTWDVPDSAGITPLQLLFMKQFAINMAGMQANFGQVARNSARPNASLAGLGPFCQQVSKAQDLTSLIMAAQQDSRQSCVNLLAYKKHGTIEVRGFTKKNGDTMGVDPNTPIRDIVFFQEVLIETRKAMRKLLLKGASPNDVLQLEPSSGLGEIADRYAQDVFSYQIIHALTQRQSGKRIETMAALVSDKDKILPETLGKVIENQAALMKSDLLAEHFLSALKGEVAWNPAPHRVATRPLQRKQSLRSMIDQIGTAGEKGKLPLPEADAST
ncbi:hypothetical protein EGT07_08555 [Herbaspirillum sp. HC18]|nr:hypothetical protein EGT07_08555 [Herbaspirillum sp. HC18]